LSINRGGIKRIGVFGGTFDPIHFGHLHIAEVARREIGLKTVFFVPTGIPPHKHHREVVAPAQHRLVMTLLATASNPHFRVSSMEMKAPGPAYTFVTLGRFRRMMGADAELYFVIGGDSLVDLAKWRKPDEVLRQSHIVAVTRPGFDVHDGRKFLGTLWDRFAERIHLIEIEGINISSTVIRYRMSEGKTIRYLVPEAVREYINRHELYSRG